MQNRNHALLVLVLGFSLSAAAGCSQSGPPPGQPGSQLGLESPTLTDSNVLTACTEITNTGSYVVGANISGELPNGNGCIYIHDTSNVELDCHGLQISSVAAAVQFTRVQGFALRNCVLTHEGGAGMNLWVQQSASGEIAGNTIGAGVVATQIDFAEADGSSSLNIHDNVINGRFQETQGTGASITNNFFKCFVQYCDSLVLSDYSTGAQISGNIMDGNTQGLDQPIFTFGSDDGIVLTDDTGDVVTGNIIRNVWDMGIEFTGTIRQLTAVGNSINNASTGGIGGWYWLSTINSLFAANTINQAGDAFVFSRIYGLRPANFEGYGMPADGGVYFSGNKFVSNSFTNAFGALAANILVGNQMGYSGGISSIPGETAPTAQQFFLSNNVFTGNDFGSEPLNFGGLPVPSGSIIDGGGNTCSDTESGFPLACGPAPAAPPTFQRGFVDGPLGGVTYVTLKGSNLSASPTTAPDAYTVSSPDCTIVPNQTYSYDGQDPAASQNPSMRQLNIAVDNTAKPPAFSCTFVLTRTSDGLIAAQWIGGLTGPSAGGSVDSPRIWGSADGTANSLAYVTLKGQYLSPDPSGNPDGYAVSSPNCTILPAQQYSYDGPDPVNPSDPSYRQVNLAISTSGQTGPFGCLFIVTRSDGRTIQSVVSGLSP